MIQLFTHRLQRGRLHAVQGVLQAQLLPLVAPEQVVRQQLHTLEGGLLALAELDQALQAVLVVGVAGDQHVPQPVGDAAGLELCRKPERPDLPQPGQACILLRVQVLQEADRDQIKRASAAARLVVVGAGARGWPCSTRQAPTQCLLQFAS